MKVLFLDIDGVLNSAFVLDEQRRGDAIDRGMVERVNKIVDATGCKIVISSTWRILHPLGQLTALLRQHGMRDVVIDKTPRLDATYFNRGDEILIWIGNHPEVMNFIALDDSAGEFDKIRDHLVATTWKHGLQDEHVVKAITLLNEKQDVQPS